MSKQQGKIGNHKFHGDPERFQVLADYIAENYAGRVRRLADVAGGQGMLCRILTKKYRAVLAPQGANFECEVVDPRGFPLVGVQNRKEEYVAEMAEYYDLIVGLHPDQALREIVFSAFVRPVIVIPCCNFWSKEEILGRDALIERISDFYKQYGIVFERITFEFKGSKNIGLRTEPPS